MILRFCFFFLGVASLCANPQNGSVQTGTAAISESGALLEIRASDGAVLNWDSFSIQAHEMTRFCQPSSNARVLNCVTGNEMSQLMGSLQANGQIFLVNPNGIVIHEGARINTAGLLATTLQIQMEEFLKGGDLHISGNSSGTIENLGTISSASGPVVLLAHRVVNRGTIEAPHVSIGAGSEFYLKPTGETDLLIRPNVENGIENEGTIRGMVVQLQSDGVQSLAINHEGIIQAERISEEGGKIFLCAPEGSIQVGKGASLKGEEVSIEGRNVYQIGSIESPKGETSLKGGFLYSDGAIRAESISLDFEEGCVMTQSSVLSTGERGAIEVSGGDQIFSSATFEAKGGTIDLSADKIALCCAQIDASGNSEGGQVSIRGDAIQINATSRLSADGQGGKIVVFSKGKVEQHGEISAKGGFVEVSGDETIWQLEKISADHVLLDPLNITISSTTGAYPQYQLVDPVQGSGGNFGLGILPLSNGNIAVTKPGSGGSTQGAVYLFNGFTGALISGVLGSSAGDLVGNGGLLAVGSGNFVARSPNWNSNRGAATFINGTTGLSGVVSSSNSLVGTTAGDQVTGGGVTALTNGNYVVATPSWNSSRGAATWGSGSSGVVGTISSSNSLVGSAASEAVSEGGITALQNGHYVVASPSWSNSKGAATWGNGTSGTTGTIGAGNSLVGITNGDQVSSGGVTALESASGYYVVASPKWNGDGGADFQFGAATWADGDGSTVGAVTTSNSLVGAAAGDQVGSGGVTALSNGRYVVASPEFDTAKGAATRGDTMGTTGTVAIGNSLLGANSNDRVSSGGVTALTNDNYVVASPEWTNGTDIAVGAATWRSGSASSSGTVATSNSIIGAAQGDQVSSGGITALSDGNYVVSSPEWSSGLGAATFASGAAPVGDVTVSSMNSLVGTNTCDRVSSGGITALAGNGNYVVSSPGWNASRGASTFGDGALMTSVSGGNSLIGGTADDEVSAGGILALANGDYVVWSPFWSSSLGAATPSSGTAGTPVGATITQFNSVIGQSALGSEVAPALAEDTVNGTFIVPFALEGTGFVRIGILDFSGLPATRAEGQTIALTPTVIQDLVNAGTSVTLAATGNISVNSALSFPTAPGGTNLNLTAGNQLTVGANISMAEANLNLTAGAGLTINNGVVVESTDGNLLLIAGTNVNGSGSATVRTTGATSTLTLVADNQFPSSPNFGSGVVSFASSSTLATGGGNLRIYTSSPAGTSLPSSINGSSAFTSFQTFGVYYPAGAGGVPFHIFYKASSLTSVFSQTVETFSAALSSTYPTEQAVEAENEEAVAEPAASVIRTTEGLSSIDPSPCQGG